MTNGVHVQGEAADLAVYLGQSQGSDPSWLLETLAGFVLSYDRAVQVLLSKVPTHHSVSTCILACLMLSCTRAGRYGQPCVLDAAISDFNTLRVQRVSDSPSVDRVKAGRAAPAQVPTNGALRPKCDR